MLNKKEYLQGEAIIFALVCLLAVPERMPAVYTICVEAAIFLGSVYLAWRFLQLKSIVRFIPSFLIAAGYNPITTFIHHKETFFLQDIASALLFFFIALSLNKNR